FTESQFLRSAAEEAQCQGFDPAILRNAVKDHLADTTKIVKLGRRDGDIRYSTPEMMKLERKLLDASEAMDQDTNKRTLPRETIELSISLTEERETAKARDTSPNAKPVSFTDEQRAAVYHATQARGRIAVIEGLAGVGKTTLLHAIRE